MIIRSLMDSAGTGGNCPEAVSNGALDVVAKISEIVGGSVALIGAVVGIVAAWRKRLFARLFTREREPRVVPRVSARLAGQSGGLDLLEISVEVTNPGTVSFTLGSVHADTSTASRLWSRTDRLVATRQPNPPAPFLLVGTLSLANQSAVPHTLTMLDREHWLVSMVPFPKGQLLRSSERKHLDVVVSLLRPPRREKSVYIAQLGVVPVSQGGRGLWRLLIPQRLWRRRLLKQQQVRSNFAYSIDSTAVVCPGWWIPAALGGTTQQEN